MFEFFTFDLTAVVIILIGSLISFKTIEYKDTEENIDTFTRIVISIMFGICMSVLFSYYTIEDDVLLTSNYWDQNS